MVRACRKAGLKTAVASSALSSKMLRPESKPQKLQVGVAFSTKSHSLQTENGCVQQLPDSSISQVNILCRYLEQGCMRLLSI